MSTPQTFFKEILITMIHPGVLALSFAYTKLPGSQSVLAPSHCSCINIELCLTECLLFTLNILHPANLVGINLSSFRELWGLIYNHYQLAY